MLQSTVAKISLLNLRHNVRELRNMNSETAFFCPMVKADAYGHGAIAVAKVLLDEGVSELGVARIEEAKALREAQLTKCRILVFDPYIDVSSAPVYLHYNITPVVSNWESLQALQKVAKNTSVSIHLKFNTGMNRLGFSLSEAARLSDYLKTTTELKLTGVCSHLLAGEDYGIEKSRTALQMQNLNETNKYFTGLSLKYHLLNSSALINLFAHQVRDDFYGARPGLAMYGVKPEILSLNPLVQERWSAIDLRPVMQIETVISQMQKVTQGQSVSYGGRFVASRDSRVVILPIGYADGYPRHFSNTGNVLFRGRRAAVVGRVCMDFTMIDVTDVEMSDKSLLGESVVIMGEQNGNSITATEMANQIDTNPYEILTNFSARIPRIYL